ncbi:alpha/beta fold hydrolase [Spongisporangium articulatum]|uniref:Alpha/beta fold hydrolase n=1 Tax=Spongisporangium articulatum TaxID=3362603 RepID=A0ABW8AS50_9ACTN
MPPEVTRWPGAEVDAGGVPVHVRRLGRAAAGDHGATRAVLVHGLGASASVWSDLGSLLAPHLSIEAVDLPGFGISPPPPGGDYSVLRFVRTLEAYLEATGGPAHVVGNSFGGLVTLALAVRRPDLVHTLTLISPAVPNLFPRGPVELGVAVTALPGGRRVLSRRWSTTSREQRADLMLAFRTGSSTAAQERWRTTVLTEIAEQEGARHSLDALVLTLRGLINSYLPHRRPTAWEAVRGLRVPTLTLWGDADALTPVRLGRRLSRAMPQAGYVELPGVGHMAHCEDPETVARLTLGHLERHGYLRS